MGAGWRKFTENFKQKAPFVGGGFTPTSNTRNEIMLREAGELAHSLKATVNAMKQMKEANAQSVTAMGKLLTSPLPRIYEDGGAGSPWGSGGGGSGAIRSSVAGGDLGGAASAHGIGHGGAVLVGGALDSEALARTPRDAGATLDAEVIAPLTAWLALYDNLVASNHELDACRLLVDSRRRTVADLTVRDAAMRAKVQRSSDVRVTTKAEDAAKLLEHKTTKLASAHDDFLKAEAELHTRLVGLIRDAAYIKVHVAQALSNQGSALLAASKIVEAPPIPEIASAPGGARSAGPGAAGAGPTGLSPREDPAAAIVGGGYGHHPSGQNLGRGSVASSAGGVSERSTGGGGASGLNPFGDSGLSSKHRAAASAQI